jgi:3-deoxy-D-manno-octulosonic-acid transferase
LGGSLIKHGGQNPIEAARFGCKIIHGPNVWNFDEIYHLLKDHKVSYKVRNLNQLTNKVEKMLTNKSKDKNLKLEIKSLGKKILNSTLSEINFYINKS